MRLTTNEASNRMEATFVVDFLQYMLKREVSNPIIRRGNTLFVNLSDQTMVRITAPKVARDTLPPQQTEARIQNIATLRYIIDHDYGYSENYGQPIKQIELRNYDECLTYLEDAIDTQLNAYFTNHLIEFITTGDKFLLAVELKQ